jgi:hypothetical protein
MSSRRIPDLLNAIAYLITVFLKKCCCLKRGDFRVTGAAIKKQILPSKLRLLYQRRPCADFVNNPHCAEPDPPHADFPNGWGGFSDAIHVDFKFPSEHRIYGQSFDGEMQVYFLHPGRRRLPAISILIQAAPSSNGNGTANGHNAFLQEAIDAFQYEYETNMAHCASALVERNRVENDSQQQQQGRRLYTINENSDLELILKTTFGNLEKMHAYAGLLQEGSDFENKKEQNNRKLSQIWSPFHESLMPTHYFFGYDGSLTEPPCTGKCTRSAFDCSFMTFFILLLLLLLLFMLTIFSHASRNCIMVCHGYSNDSL